MNLFIRIYQNNCYRLEKFIILFGLIGITDKRCFSRKDLIDLKTIEKVNKLQLLIHPCPV